MQQMNLGGYDNLLHSTNTEWNRLVHGFGWAGTESWRSQLVSTNGIIKNLRVVLDGAPGAGTKYTFTLMLNGNPTALTFDIADPATSGSDMVHEIDVAPGQTVSIQCDPDSTPTSRNATWSCVFEGDTANESLIMGGSGTSWLHNVDTEYSQVMCSEQYYSITENNHREVVPTAGTLKNFYVKLGAAPGGGGSYRFTIRKGTPPGAIGNTALTVTITDPNTIGDDVINSFVVAAGDVLTVMIEPLNAPSETPVAEWGMTFVADTDGESIVMGGSTNDLNSTITEYNLPSLHNTTSWTINESQRYNLGQVCILKKLHMLLSGAPGAGNSYTFSLNVVGDSNDVAAVVDEANTTGNSGALTDTVALDDYVDLKVVPDDTPDVVHAFWGFVSYIAPPPPWAGKISGVTNPAKIMGVDVANIAKVKGVA